MTMMKPSLWEEDDDDELADCGDQSRSNRQCKTHSENLSSLLPGTVAAVDQGADFIYWVVLF